jgi:hypothetical protein
MTVVIVVGDIDGLELEVILPTEVMVVFPGNPTEEEDEAGLMVIVTVKLDEIVDVADDIEGAVPVGPASVLAFELDVQMGSNEQGTHVPLVADAVLLAEEVSHAIPLGTEVVEETPVRRVLLLAEGREAEVPMAPAVVLVEKDAATLSNEERE